MAYGFTYTLPTITGTHSDFRCVLKTADFPSSAIDGGSSSVLNGGGNLRAYTSDAKTTQLPLHVVKFVAGGTPIAEVWVKIPSASTGGTIYLEADDVETTQPAVTGTYGRNAVWADSLAAYMLTEDPSGGAPQMIDCTGNGHDGTSVGSMTSGDLVAGKLGDCLDLDGSDDYINVGSLFSSAPTNARISLWVKPDSNRLQAYLSFDRAVAQPLIGTASSDGSFRVYSGGSSSRWTSSTGVISSGSWQKIDADYYSGRSGYWNIYHQGSPLTPATNTATTWSNYSQDVQLGALSSFGWNELDGQLDAVVIELRSLSDDWYATEYANQNAAGSWGTVGTWASEGGGITGSLAATESGLDSLSSTGSVLVAGTLAATEAGLDTATLNGAVLVSGALAVTETGADTFAASGSQSITGTLSATESGTDSSAITGAVLVSGTFAATESGIDSLIASGDIIIQGTLSATESGSDTFIATGGDISAGTLAATESGVDVFTSAGGVVVSGDVVASESGTDDLSATGSVFIHGAVAADEVGADSMAASGAVVISGSLSATEIGADSFATEAAQINEAWIYAVPIEQRLSAVVVEQRVSIVAAESRGREV